MTDLSLTIAPKSDQLNADDLIGGPRTIKITKVSACPDSAEQPVAIYFEGDNNKPYKPCKSMRRVLVQVWGKDGNAYTGRSMTIYRDPKVLFGGMAVGGIRISHMSHIESDVTMALTATKASRKPFTVKPLKAERQAEAANTAPAPARTFGSFVVELQTHLDRCATETDVNEIAARADVAKALSMKNNGSDKVGKMIKAALDRVTPPGAAVEEDQWGAEFDAAAA